MEPSSMAISKIKSTMLKKCEGCSDVDMIMWKNGDKMGQNKKVKLNDLMVSNAENALWPFDLESKVVIIVAKANEIRYCDVCRNILTERLRMPRFWWLDTYKRMNGYFGSESTINSEGSIESCSTWSRALVKHFDTLPAVDAEPDIKYCWLKFNLFTRWIMPDKMVVLAFDPVPIIKEWLCLPFMEQLNDEELQDPYWPYTHILEKLVSLHGTSVWSVRNLIRNTELSPSRDHRNKKDKPKHNYTRLHDISRHAIHVLETLDLSVKLSESIFREHKQLASSNSSVDLGFVIGRSRSSKQAYYNTRSRLAFFNNALFSLRCRSFSNHQRLNNEIQLRFHTDSQFDSQTSIEINHSTKSDSASMRWIAIVSLVFLPANMVSSIFSTTFFNGSEALSVSNDFWIYWVVLVVVTIVTMLFWFYLPRLSPEANTNHNDSAGEEAKRSLQEHMRSFNQEHTGHGFFLHGNSV